MLAFLALARLPSLEQLRYCAPGEWGKLLGLDRIPKVRTVRKKLALLCDQQRSSAWSAELCAQWMGEDPEQAVDPGMLQVLEHEIVPRLAQEVPNQPTPEQLQADAKLHRFTLIFDREGYIAFLVWSWKSLYHGNKRFSRVWQC